MLLLEKAQTEFGLLQLHLMYSMKTNKLRVRTFLQLLNIQTLPAKTVHQ